MSTLPNFNITKEDRKNLILSSDEESTDEEDILPELDVDVIPTSDDEVVTSSEEELTDEEEDDLAKVQAGLNQLLRLGKTPVSTAKLVVPELKPATTLNVLPPILPPPLNK